MGQVMQWRTKCIQSVGNLSYIIKGLSVCFLLGAFVEKQFLEWWDNSSVNWSCTSSTAATAASTGARQESREETSLKAGQEAQPQTETLVHKIRSSGWHLGSAAAKHTQCVAMGVGVNTRTFWGGGQTTSNQEDSAKLLQKLYSCAKLVAISKDNILSIKCRFVCTYMTVCRDMFVFVMRRGKTILTRKRTPHDSITPPPFIYLFILEIIAWLGYTIFQETV